ncbi:hypothetical protein CRG98_034069 [Punica granatum]|uniref:Uncharacterized protein n=1 Tax=Punica granatum TaxID=22663 RepID=A0A2I0INH1_PUNGR|nr:hypothetical protein CRG98_034069 [Punica granatum]
MGRCLIAIHAPAPSCLRHRHYLEQGNDSGLDPIPHSGYTHTMCMGALDPVTNGLGRWTPCKAYPMGSGLNCDKTTREAALDPKGVKELLATIIRGRPRVTLTRLESWMVSYPDF